MYDARATEAQIAFATSLGQEVAGKVAQNPGRYPASVSSALDVARLRWSEATKDKATMSAVIDALKVASQSVANEDRKAGSSAPAVQEGMWTVGERVFKVQVAVHGSGNMYAKELVDGSFEYVPGAMGLLAREGSPMTLEQARAYGSLYGICCVCGRTLTDESSIAAGIGPICSQKF